MSGKNSDKVKHNKTSEKQQYGGGHSNLLKQKNIGHDYFS
jgi:hypothetical protein